MNNLWLSVKVLVRDQLLFTFYQWWCSGHNMNSIWSWLMHEFYYVSIPLSNILHLNFWWKSSNGQWWPKSKGWVMLMKACMTLCGMVHLRWQCSLYCHYICVDYGLEGKLMNTWVCGYDDHNMWSLCLLSYFSCDLGCMAIVWAWKWLC